MLLECAIQEDEDSLIMAFKIDEMEQYKDILQKSKVDKLRLLINCTKLQKQRGQYYFSINPSNMVFDINLSPKIIMRDAPSESDIDFLSEFKALVGSILHPKYEFDDYYLGGKDLYKKKRILKTISKMQTIEELKSFLFEQYKKEMNILKNKKVTVKKSYAIASRIAIPVLSIIIVAFLAKGFLLFYFDLPFKNSIIKANNAYIGEDYVLMQQELQKIETDKLPLHNKFTLAKSYIMTESLSPEQKENVLKSISLMTDERVLNYWVELGRLNYANASDYVKRLGDSELLLFSKIKEATAIKNDTTIAGDEKESKTKELERQIKELTEEIQKQRREIDDKNKNAKPADVKERTSNE